MIRSSRFALSLAGLATFAWAGASERIHLSQVGFAVGQPKIAIVLDSVGSVQLVDSSSGAVVVDQPLGESTYWIPSDETCWLFKFGGYEVPGTYYVVAGPDTSHSFRITANPFHELARASIKAYWYNRSSFELPESQAGRWARPAGHPDTAVLVHSSAASVDRPEGTTIRSPGGWYDAGDYGKYVVNSGISTWTLLHLYDALPRYSDTLTIGVGAHPGSPSDLADEILWNLRWMLSMQDPADGGVYHKLTTASFSGFIMPSSDTAPRYVVQKSTAAALDLSAVAATAVRIFSGKPELVGLVDSCRKAALTAWAWARQNPTKFYSQSALNAAFTPPVKTGEYGDASLSDEFLWAASELTLMTGLDSFAVSQSLASRASLAIVDVPDWGNVASLGWLDLIAHPGLVPASLASTPVALRKSLVRNAKDLRNGRNSGYGVPTVPFRWGSNSDFGNDGLLLLDAWRSSGDTSFLNSSRDALEYLLGRNPTGYCYVTGFGSKPAMNPHHRPSFADTVVAPVPGFLVGGPNPNVQDACTYPSRVPAFAYVDGQPCYAANEVAINWNAPLVYLANFWSAHLDGQDQGVHVGPRGPSGKLDWSRSGRTVRASVAGSTLVRLELVGADGRVLAAVDGRAATLSVPFEGRSLAFLRAKSSDGTWSSASIVLP